MHATLRSRFLLAFVRSLPLLFIPDTRIVWADARDSSSGLLEPFFQRIRFIAGGPTDVICNRFVCGWTNVKREKKEVSRRKILGGNPFEAALERFRATRKNGGLPVGNLLLRERERKSSPSRPVLNRR